MYEYTPNSNVNSQANSKVKVYSKVNSSSKANYKDTENLKPTFPVFLCATILDTVTVTVLFMTPHLVTIPVKVAGGIFLPAFFLSLL